ncbi:reticulon-like protein B14 [Prosopis cineraria]|uniref:reticulon-like protein B14 n=1 Tax=Prosopis cineraria TaxID=364024 RepID=UPI00240F8FC9|nr:reticulon-like protein B14 [Prosopis cineraria]
MRSRSPSSSYESSKQPKKFGYRRSLHAALGGGKFADIMLWEDKKMTGAIVGAFTFIWFLFEGLEYPFVSLLCHLLVAAMLLLFLWYNAAGFITWGPPSVHDLQISESTVRLFCARINWFLRKFYGISIGKDLSLFFATIAGLWIMSAIGNYFTTLNLIYFMFMCMVCLPVMYERYEYEVDYLASKGNQDLRRLMTALDSKVFNKIPRGPVKEKKYK